MTRIKAVLILSFAITASAVRAEDAATRLVAQHQAWTNSHPGWVEAMEAAQAGASSNEAAGDGTLTPGTSTAWLGWIIAMVFFVAWLSNQLRAWRQSTHWARNGERDCYLIPGVGARSVPKPYPIRRTR
jgi:hypothetical protein